MGMVAIHRVVFPPAEEQSGGWEEVEMEEGERGEGGGSKSRPKFNQPQPLIDFPCIDYSGFRLHGILIWRVR